MRPTRKRAVLLIAVGLAFAGPAAGCGNEDDPPVKREPVPEALHTVESAAEDTIDLALAGERDAVVAKARALKAAADGPAREALTAAGAREDLVAELRTRAARVAALAPKADLVQVALASNRTFELVPGFFALYENPVPVDVLRLDHLDFEAKLQARAGHAAALQAAVARLGSTWARLRGDVVAEGGAGAASRFDAHVRSARQLASRRDLDGAVREAQHGLDLVDELEAVYAG